MTVDAVSIPYLKVFKENFKRIVSKRGVKTAFRTSTKIKEPKEKYVHSYNQCQNILAVRRKCIHLYSILKIFDFLFLGTHLDNHKPHI